MKHALPITVLLVAFFLVSQLFGLFLIQHEVQPTVELQANQTTVTFNDSLVGEIPTTAFDWKVIPYLAIGITIATLLILLLRKLKFGGKLWKLWYFFAVVIAAGFALEVLLVMLGATREVAGFFATFIAVILGLWKLWKNSFVLHNLTELLMYSGIAVFFVILFNNNLIYALVLLVLISLYDAYAVWKSKHMITLAKFTTATNVFPGFMLNYTQDKKGKTSILHTVPKTKHDTKTKKTTKKTSKKIKSDKSRQAILGGGDVVFPLVFAGVALGGFVNAGFTRAAAYLLSLPIVLGATLALALLFKYSKKGKFYPAMPFITAGCLLGYGILLLLLPLI